MHTSNAAIKHTIAYEQVSPEMHTKPKKQQPLKYKNNIYTIWEINRYKHRHPCTSFGVLKKKYI